MIETDRIYNTDCLDLLSRMEDETVDLVVTSPPYNKNLYAPSAGINPKWRAMRGRQIAYDVYDDAMSEEAYIQWQSKVLSECLRVLKPQGSIFYNHKEIHADGKAVNPSFIYDFPLHQTIVWNRGSSFANDPHYFQPVTEYVYWIVKDPKGFYFDKSRSAWRSNVWDINVGKILKEKNEHPAPFPTILAENCIATCCKSGGVIFDPFMGSGTTAIAALRQKCHYIGAEISDGYIEYANKRIRKHNSQPTLF